MESWFAALRGGEEGGREGQAHIPGAAQAPADPAGASLCTGLVSSAGTPLRGSTGPANLGGDRW